MDKEDSKIIFKVVLCVIFLVITPFVITGNWIRYTDVSYTGKIIDLETGVPIEGAVVAGVWHVEQYGGPAGPIQTFCDAKEA